MKLSMLLFVAFVPLLTTAADRKPIPPGDFKYLIRGEDEKKETCLLWYAEGIQGQLFPSKTQFECETTASTAAFKIDCPKDDPKSKNVKVAKASITYKCNTSMTLQFELTFKLFHGGYWQLDETSKNSKVIYQNDYTFILDGNSINAGHGFSYSCNELNVRSQKVIDARSENPVTLRLFLKRFQVQPYPEMNKKLVFHDSFDCSTWFTIPLLSSLAVSILLTVILAIGVYALLMIKTPDRFENPKGKTITVTASE